MIVMIGNGIPANYDYINVQNAAVSPSTVHCRNTALSQYFRRYLLQKAMSLFKWKLPEHWSKNYFLYVLYCWGYLAVVNTNSFGVIPQGCTLTGYNVFYQPTNAIITNPLLRGIMEPRIGSQCAIIRLQPDYGGIMDIVGYYADMLALCAESVGMNLMNTHLAYVFAAGNKTAAESFKKMYDRVASGEVCTVIDKNLYKDDGSKAWEAFEQNLKQVYISSDILSDMRKIEAMFDTDIGIPNANTDKRERLVTDEVNANNIETQSKCAMWLEELQESIKATNDMFGLDISVEWRFPDAYEGVLIMSATVSLLGLKSLNEGILGELVVPEGVDIELVKDNLLAETAELEVIYPDAVFMQAMIGRWSAKELPVWDRLYKTTLLEYNPIENYDRKEKCTEDENTTKNLDSEETGSNTTQASDSSKSHGERENNDGTSKYVSAYNETEFTPTERITGNSQVIGDSNASSESDINTKTKNGLVSDETGKRALDREVSIHGNNGFYTKQKMIEQERSIAEYNIIDVIINSFKNRFCLQVY